MFVETARGYANLAHVVRMVVVEDGMMLTGITGAALGVADVTEALAAARAAGFLANRTQTEFFNPADIAYTARGPSNRMSPRIVTDLYSATGAVIGQLTDPPDWDRLTEIPDAA